MKYLNFVLSLIAFCLLVITLNILGFIPSANANNSNTHFAPLPFNPDGSLNVKIAKGETIDVNIDEVGGHNQMGKTLDVNLEEIDGSGADYPLHVEIEK